jgi:sulfate adenylyltransferase subunit 1
LNSTTDPGVLRLLTCGSVDDGKSTLIGRLLFDTKALLDDTLATLERHAERRGLSAPDLSLLTDGLVAEREQGITIDVAYRYFATARRKFIIADSPGHVQYTRNMCTAASTADLAVLLVDGRKGILPQTRRHATLAGLLGVEQLVLAVNKMDLVDFSEARFHEVEAEFRAWLSGQPGLHADVQALPLSALDGANVVDRDPRLAWFTGPTLVELLEQAPARGAAAQADLRLPVQWVCRPEQSDFRGYAGRIEAGRLAVGDTLSVFPSGAQAVVQALQVGLAPRDSAHAGEAVLVSLDRELDISRGDVLGHPGAGAPQATRALSAVLCWMGSRPLEPQRDYLLQQGTRLTRTRIDQIEARLDIDTLAWQPGDAAVGPNDIARVALRTQHPVLADAYAGHRSTGCFILVDPATHDTVAAGTIDGKPANRLDA